MTLSKEFSCMYDTWFFFLLHFNEEYFRKEFEEQYGESNIAFSQLTEIKSKLSGIPSYIAPFFKLCSHETVLQSLFFSLHSPQYMDVNIFIDDIYSNTDKIYDKIIEKYFPEQKNCLDNQDKSDRSFIQYLDKSNLPLEEKFQLSLLLSDYSHAIETLANTILSVHCLVSDYHDEHREIISSVFEKANTDENIESYNELLGIDRYIIESSSVAVSLFNPYIITVGYDDENPSLLLGQNNEVSIYKTKLNKSYTASNFVTACGNEMRMKLLEALTEHEEMTLSEFSVYAGTPFSTTTHNVKVMLNAGILKTSRIEAKCVYYTINKPAITQAMHELNILFNKLKRRKE